jgi:hypothetical protein
MPSERKIYFASLLEALMDTSRFGPFSIEAFPDLPYLQYLYVEIIVKEDCKA